MCDRQRAFWVLARLHGVNVEMEQADVVGVASEPLLKGVDELLRSRLRLA